MSRYPSIDELPLGPENELLLVVRRSVRSSLSHLTLFGVTSGIVALLWYYFGTYRLAVDIPILNTLSVKWLVIVPLYFILELARRHHDDLYEFGQHRLTHKGGRLSLHYSVPVVKYVDIRAISVSQDVIGRLFNYGNIEVETAAQTSSEMVIEGVVDPIRLATLLDQLRSRSERFNAGAGKRRPKTWISPHRVPAMQVEAH